MKAYKCTTAFIAEDGTEYKVDQEITTVQWDALPENERANFQEVVPAEEEEN